MAFIQDPRLRQRWNQISHNAEAVTENAAAGIWNFQHRYLTPCLSGVGEALDSCTAVCLGDREERARRARERDRGARRTGMRAEYMFDFYDDWDDADDEAVFPGLPGSASAGGSSGGGGGILGSWGGGRSEDWDRLLAGTGAGRGVRGVERVTEQPKRKRGMSYGTRGSRRKLSGAEEDPTIIPSTAPLGFLGRLPFKIGSTLRYKPSAANLRDHPGSVGVVPDHSGQGPEHEPLLGASDEDRRRPGRSPQPRPRSSTTGSGDTSSSYRSRGDLFPSDEEGDEDAIPLDDEFAVALDRVELDRASNKTRSSKGKRPEDGGMPRTVSRTTMSSTHSRDSAKGRSSSSSFELPPPSLEDLQQEELDAAREEQEEQERKRIAATRLARERGLSTSKPEQSHQEDVQEGIVAEVKDPALHLEEQPEPVESDNESYGEPVIQATIVEETKSSPTVVPIREPEPPGEFVPARLPHFR